MAEAMVRRLHEMRSTWTTQKASDDGQQAFQPSIEDALPPYDMKLVQLALRQLGKLKETNCTAPVEVLRPLSSS